MIVTQAVESPLANVCDPHGRLRESAGARG
jgi:hypothetical protein